MSAPRGVAVPERWSPLRGAVERILADGAWHETELLFYQVERFVDPRLAARCWAREYRRHAAVRVARGAEAADVEPASRVLARNEVPALEVGKRRVYWDCIRAMRRRGRAQIQGWGGRRRVRLILTRLEQA